MRWIKIFDNVDKGKEIISEGTSRLVIIGEKRICLSHVKDSFRACADKCPHLGDELHKGKINYLGEIICPWHSYTFNLITGEEVGRRCDNVKIYPVKSDQKGFFIGIE